MSDTQAEQLKYLRDVSLIKLESFERDGSLVVLEGLRDIPFAIKRVFYIFGAAPDRARGEHAHRKCTQFLVCMAGRCDVLCDDGAAKGLFTLDHPTKGLLVPSTIWASESYCSRDTVLLVLTDRIYSEADYIRNYAEFVNYRQP